VLVVLPLLATPCRLTAQDIPAADPYAVLVETIIRTPQTYDGEVIDKLTNLGPEAVPAIGAALGRGPRFPMTLVRSLERIGSPAGMEPILAFLAQLAPYSDADDSKLTEMTILALRGVRNAGACRPLATILADETAHPRARLAAASAITRLCTTDLVREAQRFILAMYEDRERHFAGVPQGSGFASPELFSALIDADSAESEAILLDILRTEQTPYLIQPVIEYFATKGGADAEQALLAIVDNSLEHEMHVRVAAASALLEIGGPSVRELRKRAESLLHAVRQRAEQAGPSWQPLVEQAERVFARATAE
jgi:HEAT repeat protein